MYRVDFERRKEDKKERRSTSTDINLQSSNMYQKLENSKKTFERITEDLSLTILSLGKIIHYIRHILAPNDVP